MHLHHEMIWRGNGLVDVSVCCHVGPVSGVCWWEISELNDRSVAGGRVFTSAKDCSIKSLNPVYRSAFRKNFVSFVNHYNDYGLEQTHLSGKAELRDSQGEHYSMGEWLLAFTLLWDGTSRYSEVSGFQTPLNRDRKHFCFGDKLTRKPVIFSSQEQCCTSISLHFDFFPPCFSSCRYVPLFKDPKTDKEREWRQNRNQMERQTRDEKQRGAENKETKPAMMRQPQL